MNKWADYRTAMDLPDLKKEINRFFAEHDNPTWTIVSINEGMNRSYTVWFECDNTGTKWEKNAVH